MACRAQKVAFFKRPDVCVFSPHFVFPQCNPTLEVSVPLSGTGYPGGAAKPAHQAVCSRPAAEADGPLGQDAPCTRGTLLGNDAPWQQHELRTREGCLLWLRGAECCRHSSYSQSLCPRKGKPQQLPEIAFFSATNTTRPSCNPTKLFQ